MDGERATGCGCCGTAAGSTDVGTGGGADVGTAVGEGLVCTLDGGPDAVRARAAQWQAVAGRAVGREVVDGGITLLHEPDPATAAELARLAAAEVACCSFFTFTLTVGPAGTRFTATAPAAARPLVSALFDTADAIPGPVAAAGTG